jgi:hypothetical protein
MRTGENVGLSNAYLADCPDECAIVVCLPAAPHQARLGLPIHPQRPLHVTCLQQDLCIRTAGDIRGRMWWVS